MILLAKEYCEDSLVGGGEEKGKEERVACGEVETGLAYSHVVWVSKREFTCIKDIILDLCSLIEKDAN